MGIEFLIPVLHHVVKCKNLHVSKLVSEGQPDQAGNRSVHLEISLSQLMDRSANSACRFEHSRGTRI